MSLWKAEEPLVKSFIDWSLFRLNNNSESFRADSNRGTYDLRANRSNNGNSAEIIATTSQLGSRLDDRSRPRTSVLFLAFNKVNHIVPRSLGHVFRISPSGSQVATFSLSTLTSRSLERFANFPLILSKFTASTCIAPFDEPSTICS